MASTGFNYSGATYGRSASGLNKLVANLQKDIGDACTAMTGSNYNHFLNVVRKYWQGADATAFINSFKKDIADAKVCIKGNSKKIETALRTDNKKFLNMQKVNASSMSKINAVK